MAELLSIKEMPKTAKIALLKKIGYDSDGKFVLKNGKRHLDKYINGPVMMALSLKSILSLKSSFCL